MPDRKVEDEVLKLEKRYWDAIKADDFETALSLTDDPCIVTGAQGVQSFDHDSFRKMMKASTWKLKDFKMSDVQVRKVTDDLALVAYKVKESMMVEGKQRDFEAADSSTWIRRNGKGVCALHTEAIAGDPFGKQGRQAAP